MSPFIIISNINLPYLFKYKISKCDFNFICHELDFAYYYVERRVYFVCEMMINK